MAPTRELTTPEDIRWFPSIGNPLSHISPATLVRPLRFLNPNRPPRLRLRPSPLRPRPHPLHKLRLLPMRFVLPASQTASGGDAQADWG